MSLIRVRALKSVLLSLLISLCVGIAPSPISLPANAAEVDTSSVGTKFDFALPTIYRASGSNHPFSGWKLYLSSSQVGTATVTWPDATTSTINLVAGGVATQEVNNSFNVSTTNGVISSKLITVTSTVPISMYGCNLAEAASDCTNFFPTPTFGNRYRLNYGPSGLVMVFAADEAATLTFVPKSTMTAGTNTYTAGQSYTINLAAKQVWEIRPNVDFTGSLITSSAPVGVLNGWNCQSASTVFPSAGGACDSGSQIVPPVTSWGTEYYSVNYRNTGTTGSGYRIVADQNNTVVQIRGDESATVTLQAGEDYKLHAFQSTGSSPNKSISIKSNNPILVGHWFFAGQYDSLEGGDNGDMSMGYVTPFQQYMNSYIVANPTGFKGSFINLVVPAAITSTIKIDGNVLDQTLFRTIAGSSWKSAQVQVNKGTHVVTASQAFGIEVYGIGFFDSYAYTGGQSTADVASVAQLQLQASNVSGVVGQQVCVPIRVLDSSSVPVSGIRVDASITGVSGSIATIATSDSNGWARVCYVGTAVGTDSVSISSNGYTSSATVTWSLTAPVISYSPATVSLALNATMPSLVPTNTAGLASSWTISPNLPSGLSFNASTGAVTGTPTVASGATTYTVTATNTAGSGSTTVSIAVASGQTPAISYSPSTFTFTLDQAISLITPTTSGSYSVWSTSPALPSGLTLNAQDGTIRGTPTRVSSSRTYTITASNSAGSNSTTLTLSVTPTTPDITFSPETRTVYIGYQASRISPVNSGSPATSWAISPSLSTGLSFDAANGSIFGTPSGSAVAETTYTVTATNSAGSDSATVKITVSSSAPAPDISYDPSTVSGVIGTMINAVNATSIGGPVTTWSISPALPAGLTFSASNGRISGTPTTSSGSTVYTITATNASNVSDTAQITITVANPPAPDFAYQENSYTFTKGNLITAVNPVNIGGPVASWSISPSLPTGMIFDTTIGQISGTPTVASTATTYTVTATNLGGSDTFDISITVVTPPLPVISYSPATVELFKDSAAFPMNPTNTGGTATSWSISPSLSAGLSFNTSTGAITGTPTALQTARTHTVTATNGGGSATTPISIAVITVSVPTISYSPSTINAILAKALGNKTPTVTGGAITGYTISKPLPTGLNFNTTTGVISGTPTAIAPSDSYTVTVTNSAGSATATIRLKVYDTISLGDETTNSYQTGKNATSTVNTSLGTTSKVVIVGYPETETVRLVLTADRGTMKFNSTTGLTAATGYQNPIGAAAASIGFIGTVAAMNSALETLSFIASSNVETATVTADLSYIGTGGAKAYYTPNEHYYEFVSTAVTWNAAYDATVGCQKTYNGLCGYLATVTSSQENDFIVSKVGTAAAWLGGADNGGRANDTSLFSGWAEGTWRWVDGPSSEKGVQFSNGSTSVSSRYVNWNTSEPNNVGVGGEHVLQILSGGTGKWNDLPQNSSLMGYVIEYGGFETETVTYPGVTRILTIGIADIPPAFSYSSTNVSLMRNVAMTTLTPSSTGGTATSWTIAPSLPAGLSFNTSTGVISGTPTAQSASTAYQVVATNAQGSDTRTITIEVVIPPSISYSPASLSATTGSAISALTPTNTGGPVSSWSVSPALPAGLTLNTTTGVISGTPTTVQAATNYTITATNLGQTSTFVLSITVNAPAPAGGGGANAPAKVTALYFKIVDPNDETKAYTKKVCISVYSRDLSPRFLASGCSDDQGNVNLLAGDAKVTVKVYESGYGDKTRDYNGTIGSDTFDLDGSKYFPGTTRWVVTFPKAAAPTPTPSPTPTPTPSPTVTPSPSPTKAPDLGPVTSADSLKPGVVSVLINGKVVTVTVTPNYLRDGLVIKGDGWTINVSTLDPNGKARPLTAQGYLDAVVEGRIKVTGTGFAPNSEYRIYLFANLIQLETAKTNDAGGFTTTLQLPDSIKAGNQVLQVNALGSNNEVRSISIGLVISAKPAPSATAKPSPTPTKASSLSSLNQVVSFDFAKFKVSSKQVATLKKLNLTGKNVRVSLTGYAQKSGTRDDLRISLDRALEVKKAILKINPKAKVTVLGGGTKPVAQCKAFANRCVIAKVVKG